MASGHTGYRRRHEWPAQKIHEVISYLSSRSAPANPFSYPTPPRAYFNVVSTAVKLRRFILRHLSLPRPSFLRVYELSDHPDPKSGRFHPHGYLVHPYYNKPRLWNRWGPWAWYVWFSGGDVPGSKGSLYVPEGYTFEEIGPASLKNKRLDVMKGWQKKLEAERPMGCPFAISGWSIMMRLDCNAGIDHSSTIPITGEILCNALAGAAEDIPLSLC